MEFEKKGKPVNLVVGMACERNDMMKMQFFKDQAEL